MGLKMETVKAGRLYEMQQLGSGGHIGKPQTIWVSDKEPWDGEPAGIPLSTLAKVLILRTRHLNEILPCEETMSVLWYLGAGIDILRLIEGFAPTMRIAETVRGHVYTLWDTAGIPHTISFVRRGSGVVKYRKEWPGIQSQELLRVMIAVLKTSNRGNPDLRRTAIDDLRRALFFYEARALRRKSDNAGRTAKMHDSSERLRPWRPHPFEDVPFDHEDIEYRLVGADGHILLSGEEGQWFMEYHLRRIAENAKQKAA